MDPASPLDDEQPEIAGSSGSSDLEDRDDDPGPHRRPNSGTAPGQGLDHGDTVNLIACLRRRLEAHEEMAKLTDVQNRVIMQRLEEAGTWSSPRASVRRQLEEMAALVAEIVPLSKARLRSWLADCLERTRNGNPRDGMPS